MDGELQTICGGVTAVGAVVTVSGMWLAVVVVVVIAGKPLPAGGGSFFPAAAAKRA